MIFGVKEDCTNDYQMMILSMERSINAASILFQIIHSQMILLIQVWTKVSDYDPSISESNPPCYRIGQKSLSSAKR